MTFWLRFDNTKSRNSIAAWGCGANLGKPMVLMVALRSVHA
jgi:hypothetical protein